MSAVSEATVSRIPEGIEYSSGREEASVACFRCGVCCIRYQVPLTLVEARQIAEGLGLSFNTFLGRYVEPQWHTPDGFLLRQCDGACVFLVHTEGSKKTSCFIHHVKPAACREWTPSLYRKECREGLAVLWQLTVSPSGQLEGAEEKL